MRRVGTPAEKTNAESFRGHDTDITDIQDNSGSSVTAAAGDPLSAFAGLQNSGSSVTTAAPAEQPDETKDAEETPRGSRKKKA